jgi:hypothetical protein
VTGGAVLLGAAHVIEQMRLSCAAGQRRNNGFLHEKRALKSLSHQWTKRQGWDMVMNHFMVLFHDRLSPTWWMFCD